MRAAERFKLTFGAELPGGEVELLMERLGVTMEMDESELKGAISGRVDKLASLLEEESEPPEEGGSDVAAHFALRMVAAADERGRVDTWFINNECAALRSKLERLQREDHDEFLEAVSPLLFCERIQYMRDYSFGRDKRQLARETGVDPDSLLHIALDWRAVPSSVSAGRCVLHGGTAILERGESTLLSQSIRNYEKLLRKKIAGLASRLTVEEIDYYSELGQSVIKEIKSTSTAFVEIDDLKEEMALFPPCIVMLDSKISRGFEVEHLEFLQLGFFLREAGLTFPDYQRYWYLRHPANQDKSWEEFVGSHWGSYQLRHHYGEMGGGKRYNAFSCKKAQSDACCPFRDLDEDDLADFLLGYLEEKYRGEGAGRLNGGIEHILSMKKQRYYGAACAAEFKLRLKASESDWVNHPIYNYYRPAKVLRRKRLQRRQESGEARGSEDKAESKKRGKAEK